MRRYIKLIAFIIVVSCVLLIAYEWSSVTRSTVIEADDKISFASTSGGYILETVDYYYYANLKDDNKLYRMEKDLSDPIKISDHANATPFIELKTANDKLFYFQIELSGTEWPPYIKNLWCYDLHTKKESVLLKANVVSYAIADDLIYCSTIGPAQEYRMRMDGSELTRISLEYPDTFVIRDLYENNGNLLYACNESIVRYDINTEKAESIPGYSNGMVVWGDYLYSINYNQNNALVKYKKKGVSIKEEGVLVEKDVASFTVYNDGLIYVSQDNKIYKITNGGKTQFLSEGSFPITTRQHLFYFDLYGNLCWKELL